jgi:hypothetical protein
MLLLPRRIGLGQNRPGLAQPKVQLTEQSLALADSQLNPIRLFDPCRQRLAIPQVHPHPCIARLVPECPADLFHLFRTQPAWPSGSISLRQSGQPLSLVTMNPILDRTRSVAEQPGDLRAGQALRHEQDAVQAVIVARLLRTLDLLLQTQHGRGIGYREWSHDYRRTRSNSMRNYL